VVNASPRLLYPRKEIRYLLYRRLDVLQGLPGRVLKISPPLRLDPKAFIIKFVINLF
jgi:hypothetical protein